MAAPIANNTLTVAFLTQIYDAEHREVNSKPVLKGFVAKETRCEHCNRIGHAKNECWKLKPQLRPSNNEPEGRGRKKGIKCYNCGEFGHIKRECKKTGTSNVLATLNTNENIVGCYSRTFVDSGSSVHTVTNLNLLNRNSIKRTEKEVSSVDGTKLKLTHVGSRTINTGQGMIVMSKVYFAKELKYNLLSVPAMVAKGVTVTLGKSKTHIEKNGTVIRLENIDGLWAVPEVGSSGTVASLRMNVNGKTDAKTWHQRLGHTGDRKIERMVKDNIIPAKAAGYESRNCETCHRSFPGRRPVPRLAERSGQTTIQVDYVPMGKEERGWKGEVGAYVYTSRASKLTKAYPVKDASAASAAEALEQYCRHILPNVKENVNCVQTDAGTQFDTNKWSIVCAKHKINHRTCPVDHQAMNGQAERVIGILMSKTRALLMDKGVERNYWPLALEAATFIYNRTLHGSLGGRTPFDSRSIFIS